MPGRDLCCELNDNANLCALRDSFVAEWGAPWRVVDGLILHDAYVFIPMASATLPASSSSSTPSAMRASRKLYIDYAPSSSSSRIAHWFVTLCARAPCAKGTRWNPFSRWVCCNP